MPTPRPLTNLTSAREVPTEYQLLTPRTPHSRSARSESFTDIELERLDDTEEDEEDNAGARSPLLPTHSSSVQRTSLKKRLGGKLKWLWKLFLDAFNDWRKDLRIEIVLARIPILVGGMLAAFMVYLVLVSYDSPGAFDRYFNQFYNKTWHPDMIISYANYSKFPLRPHDYLLECYKLHPGGYMLHHGYWSMNRMSLMDVLHPDEIPGHLPRDPRECRRSITYMLGGDVGLMADLALMAQAAALARERNVSFLVDDTYWDRGKWTDHFEDVHVLQPGPQPGCRPPPPQELVACPRLARHWVITARTAEFHFGPEFKNHYENPYGRQLNRVKSIFDFASTSLATTIQPNARILELIKAARLEMLRTFPQSDKEHPNTQYTSVHIRRGDRKAKSWAFHDSYVPVPDFVEGATSIWERVNPNPPPELALPRLFLASDSREAIREFKQKFGHTTIYSLVDSKDSRLSSLASPGEYFQSTFGNLTLEQRVRATQGMIIDFALLTGAWGASKDPKPEAVICGISAVACKLAAPVLGWEKAFGNMGVRGTINQKEMRWIDVDEKGVALPGWDAFDLFN